MSKVIEVEPNDFACTSPKGSSKDVTDSVKVRSSSSDAN